jgi:Leucine-rich repeat (LRR) protein
MILERIEKQLDLNPFDTGAWVEFLKISKRLNQKMSRMPSVLDVRSKKEWKWYHETIRQLEITPEFFFNFLKIGASESESPYSPIEVEDYPNLSTLNITNSPTGDLCWLVGLDLSNLMRLNLSANNIVSLDGLIDSNCNNIEYLWIADSSIYSLDAISGWNVPDLMYLQIDNNSNLLSLSGLKNIYAPKLEQLYVTNNIALKGISEIEGWKQDRIEHIVMYGNAIKSLKGLSGVSLQSLESWDLRENNVQSIEHLVLLDAPNFKSLILSDNYGLSLSPKENEEIHKRFPKLAIDLSIYGSYSYDDYYDPELDEMRRDRLEEEEIEED